MIETKEFYNVKCDCCGSLADPETWSESHESAQIVARESNWRHLGGRDYCPDCCEYDDDDNIITKDGYKYTEDGDEIIWG